MEESQMKIKKLVIPATLALSMAFSFVPTMTFPAITTAAEASAYQAPATTAVKLSKGEVTVYDCYNTYPAVPIYATEKALASWGENGGVSALTNNFVQAFGDTVDTNLPAKAAIVRDGDTVKVAGIDFKILPTPDEDYSVEIPSIGVVYRHMMGSTVHNILSSIDYIDAEIANMERYQKNGYQLILTSHYIPEGQEAVAEKLQYLQTVKELALSSKDKADFIQQVTNAFPSYEGTNYLEMSAGLLFKK
jgi:hypothetical protein